MKRESFGSRLGFILVSAGCAIGLGNVWKFPYICGKYGGAAFILIYLFFLLAFGLPMLVCEFSIGRGSRRSIAESYHVLEPKGSRWHTLKYIGIIGNYMLMMYYTMVSGWTLHYCFRFARGDFSSASPEFVSGAFDSLTGDAPVLIFWTIVVCVLGFLVCLLGLEGGVERITKVLMLALLSIMIILAVRSILMPGSAEGLRFYLLPDFQKIIDNGIGNVLFAALSQAFFTLSVGIGSMVVFSSYLDKSRSLTGEAVCITILDTFVAITAGLIIIPACFSFGVKPSIGPGLTFVTLPNIFAQMNGGRLWGTLFFLFLSFAALSTINAVFESIIAFNMETRNWSRKKSILFSMTLLIPLCLPCILGFNVWSGIQPFGEGSTIMDLEDFIVSNNLIPLGGLASVLFCSSRRGWGWKNFMEEANTGTGLKFPRGLHFYVGYIMPLILVFIYLKGYYDMFSPKGTRVLCIWMGLALLLLLFVLRFSLGNKKQAEPR